jgi:hypothetical protein
MSLHSYNNIAIFFTCINLFHSPKLLLSKGTSSMMGILERVFINPLPRQPIQRHLLPQFQPLYCGALLHL